jgi:hypothetical protein
MNVMAIAMVLVLGITACVALGFVAWGLVLEARSNRCWREQGLAR